MHTRGQQDMPNCLFFCSLKSPQAVPSATQMPPLSPSGLEVKAEAGLVATTVAATTVATLATVATTTVAACRQIQGRRKLSNKSHISDND
jgi:hypothetical protein